MDSLHNFVLCQKLTNGNRSVIVYKNSNFELTSKLLFNKIVVPLVAKKNFLNAYLFHWVLQIKDYHRWIVALLWNLFQPHFWSPKAKLFSSTLFLSQINVWIVSSKHLSDMNKKMTQQKLCYSQINTPLCAYDMNVHKKRIVSIVSFL